MTLPPPQPGVWIEWVGSVAGVAAIVGVILNNRRRRECFLIWFGSNALSCAVHIAAGVWSLAARDAVFFLLAVDGWRAWRKGANE